MAQVFAIATRGLEQVSAEEMATLPGVTVEQVAYRRVTATCAGGLAPLLGLRTVDDVFLDVATWDGIGRPQATLARLEELSAALDLRAAAARCASVRALPDSPAFSVTANFVGRRNYSMEEIKQACAQGLARRHRWPYSHGDDEADLNLRVFIEHDVAFVGVRLGKTPLHRRAYKHAHVSGSLKPPVAAALLFLAGVTPGKRVLDPCCGAGTILIEAALSGAAALGGDSDPAAIVAAQTNAALAAVKVDVRQWDAQQLPVADVSVDRIISNLPWGREVSAEPGLGSFTRRVCAEMRRVIVPGGRIALLTNVPRLVDLSGLRLDWQIEISLFGQTPAVMVFSA